MHRKRQVVIIGDSAEFPEKNQAAHQIGRFIAKKRWVLINGGRGGVMQASSEGAFQENGTVVAIIPDTELDQANPYASIVIPSGIGFARNYTNALSGDVIVVIGGGTGTLCELSYAWQANKPIIACSFIDGCSKDYAGKKMDYRRETPVLEAKNLTQVFQLLEEILG